MLNFSILGWGEISENNSLWNPISFCRWEAIFFDLNIFVEQISLLFEEGTNGREKWIANVRNHGISKNSHASPLHISIYCVIFCIDTSNKLQNTFPAIGQNVATWFNSELWFKRYVVAKIWGWAHTEAFSSLFRGFLLVGSLKAAFWKH